MRDCGYTLLRNFIPGRNDHLVLPGIPWRIQLLKYYNLQKTHLLWIIFHEYLLLCLAPSKTNKQTTKQQTNHFVLHFSYAKYSLFKSTTFCFQEPTKKNTTKTREDRNNLVATRFACELLLLCLWLLVHCLVLPDYSWFYSIIKHWLVIENCFIWPWTKSGNSYSISRLSKKTQKKKKTRKKTTNKINTHQSYFHILFSLLDYRFI